MRTDVVDCIDTRPNKLFFRGKRPNGPFKNRIGYAYAKVAFVQRIVWLILLHVARSNVALMLSATALATLTATAFPSCRMDSVQDPMKTKSSGKD